MGATEWVGCNINDDQQVTNCVKPIMCHVRKAVFVRFAFGKNWETYSRHIDETRIQNAHEALVDLVGDLTGRTFLDVGCGSGIHSLAALKAGSLSVTSFDFDNTAVRTAQTLRASLAPDSTWEIYQGDILEPREGTWDVVYAWGSLHHTGNMRLACENVSSLVTPGGTLAISIYNDQGWVSRVWSTIKRLYVSVPLLRPPLLLLTFVLTWGPTLTRECLSGRNPVQKWRDYGDRGMTPWTDLLDWAGGYPFEYASVDDVVQFFEARGMRLQRVKSVGRKLGCNEFVFKAHD